MKRLLGWMLAVMLLAMNLACAEEFPCGEFVHLKDGDEIVLRGDALTVRFTPGGAYGEEEYTLQIGDSAPVSDRIWTDAKPELLAVQYEYGETYFFIGGGAEDGEAIYHVYEYLYDRLYKRMKLNRMPGEFRYSDGRGIGEILRATKYGSFFVEIYDVTALGGFTHEQEYVIASKGDICDIQAVPEGMYPFGRIVEIAQDLPLLTSREDGAETVMLNQYDHAMIVASDGSSWAYLARVIEEEDQEWCAGWVKLVPGSILVDGQEAYASEYINGIVIGG